MKKKIESVEVAKQMVFLNYFDKVEVLHGEIGMYVDIKDARFAKHYQGLQKKYSFKKSWSDLKSEYVLQSWKAIKKFEVDSDDELDTWLKIYEQTDDFEENKLIKYIKTTVGWKIHEFANPNSFRTTTTKNGKKVHYTIVLEMSSLDKLMSGDEDSVPLELSDENMLFDAKMYDYYTSYFQKWLDKNRDEILTAKQAQFLDDLKKCSKDPYLTAEEFEEKTGVKWANYSRWLRRIEDRILKSWKESKPSKQSRRQLFNENRIKFLEEIIEIAEDDENLLVQNLELTNKLVEAMNDKHIELDAFHITNGSLNKDELVEFNRIVNNNNFNSVKLSSQALYKIVNEAYKRLDKLKREQDFVEPEVDYSNHRKRKTERRKLITKNGDGEIVKVQHLLVDTDTKHKNIWYLQPSGAISQQKTT